jgi:hypothetical protein
MIDRQIAGSQRLPDYFLQPLDDRIPQPFSRILEHPTIYITVFITNENIRPARQLHLAPETQQGTR